MKKLSRADQASLVESYDFKYLALIDDAKQKIIEELKNQHPELARFITNNTIAVDLYIRSSTTVSGYIKTGRIIDFVISNGTIELVYERNGYTRYVDLESAMTGADAYFGNLTRSMSTYKVLKAIKDIATALNRQHKNVTGLRDKKAYKALNDEVAKELKQHIRAIRYEIPLAEEYSAVDMPNIDQEDFDQWAEKAAENLNKIHENFFNLPFAMTAVDAGMVSDRPLFTEKGDPIDTNRNIANSWHAIGKITFDCQISQLSDDAKAVIKASRPTGTANIDNKKIVDCVRLANALIKYFNNDVSFFRDKHMNTTALAASFKPKRQAMTLQEEFKLYETMWDMRELEELNENATKEDLIEWRSSNGNSANTTQTSNGPYRKKPIQHGRYSWADYSSEFTKLDAHIQNVHGKLANSWQYDKMIKDDTFRTYWVDKNDTEYRLEVTTTNVSSGEVVEHWDFVLEETEPNAHIIDRGYLRDYHHLLDKLLQYGVITDKSKCI